jgi:hypothetical protein
MDIRAARQSFDLRTEVEKCLGKPKGKTSKSSVYLCPFHNDSTPSLHIYEETYYCFGCGEKGDVFDFLSFWNKVPLADILKDQHLDPTAELERKIEYAKHAHAVLEEEIKHAEAVLFELQTSRCWEKFNEQQTEFSHQWWEHAGIPEDWQNFWKLGFIPEYTCGEHKTPAMTIPIFDVGWECINIRMRLVNPPQAGDKYRPYKSGLPAPMFIADPDKPIGGKTLICEGEKKAAVAFITADNNELQVVGLPGKNPSSRLIEKLKNCDPAYICLDPDADPVPLAKEIGVKQVRIIRLQKKLDDTILDNGLGKSWMNCLLNQARRM